MKDKFTACAVTIAPKSKNHGTGNFIVFYCVSKKTICSFQEFPDEDEECNKYDCIHQDKSSQIMGCKSKKAQNFALREAKEFMEKV
ncbi:MAG: hypothetical protein OQK82_01355 [Candidatus Pacearchaeota archaeon]|nr:hypothetical protein [Candidatus Pacearchaeota archaeon]